MSFQPSSVLLDKGVIRRIYEFNVRRSQNETPTAAQLEAVEVFGRLYRIGSELFIIQQTANILRRRPPRYARPILNDTGILRKGRYLRRWSRRLRSFAFSPEDAVILAYGIFGIGADKLPTEIEVIVTTDHGMSRNFIEQRTAIHQRFDRMIRNLREPYSGLLIPSLMTTADVLTVT